MACQLCISVFKDIANNLNQTLFDKYVNMSCSDNILSNETCALIQNNNESVFLLFMTLLNTGVICKQLQICVFELISKFLHS